MTLTFEQSHQNWREYITKQLNNERSKAIRKGKKETKAKLFRTCEDDRDRQLKHSQNAFRN